MPHMVRMRCPSCRTSWDHDATSSQGSEVAKGFIQCPECGVRMADSALADLGASARAASGSRPSPSTDDTPPVPTRRASVPKRIGRFELKKLIGDGGYGRVYLANDPKLNRDVALKVLKGSRVQGKALKRFFRESQAAAQLNHPSIVALYDAGYDEDRCWIAYQPIDGEPLSRLIGTKDLTPEKSVDILIGIAWALDHAHSRGVYHRDLKPANVLIDRSGHARLTDFGLARQSRIQSDLTQEGAVIGTPAYMSPEQAAGKAHLADGRSDIYSLGVIMREMLSLNHVRQATRPRWTLDEKSRERPRSNSARGLAGELVQICQKATASRKEDRYQTARGLAEALEAWRDRGHRWAKVLPGIALGVLGGALLVSLVALAMPLLGNLSVKGWLPDHEVAGPSAPPAPFVGNRNSNVYHRAECKNLKQMSAKNRVEFRETARALAEGFSPCQLCRP